VHGPHATVESSPHLAGEAALPGQYFNERHGTASVYRVWRSHPSFRETVIRGRWCRPGARAGSSADTVCAQFAQSAAEIRNRPCRDRNIVASDRKTGLIFAPSALSGPPSSPINAPNHRGPAPYLAPSGEVAEWLNAPHSKCGIGASLSGVRIPPSPPVNLPKYMISRTLSPRIVARSPNKSPNSPVFT
jgi:hypothetical protein